ncbi:MAG: YIP1 family protein [Gemmatimonadetes bacterium]|nr:YIP1 family protein [Gemmatimonadota bacterium]
MSDPSASPADAPTPAETASVVEDFLDIFYAPAAVFARRANGNFWIPMLVVMLMTGAIFLATRGVTRPIMDAEMARAEAAQMKKNPQITPDQLAVGRNIQEKVAPVGAFLFPPIGILLVALTLWLVGKMFGATQTWNAALVVSSYAYILKPVEGFLNGAQAMMMNPASLDGRLRVSLGVARFLDPATTSPVLLAAIGRLDLFTIWLTALLAIGLSVTGRISRRDGAIAAVIVWIIGALPGVIGALLQG